MKKNYERPEIEELDVKDTHGIQYDVIMGDGSGQFDDKLNKQ